MKTLNQKKYNWGALLLILVFVLGVAILYFNGDFDMESKNISVEKNKILENDSIQLKEIANVLQMQNDKILNIIADDSVKIKTTPALEENLKINKDKFSEVQKVKNKIIFERMIKPKENIPLKLCVIIIACGILGGLASGYYKYLEDILKINNDVKKEALEMKQLCEQSENSGFTTADVKPMTEAIEKVENIIGVLVETIDQEKNRYISRILFGVISSFFAVLILKAGDSKILEFATYMDYFVFACYCLLCALFSKKIIETLSSSFVKGINEVKIPDSKN